MLEAGRFDVFLAAAGDLAGVAPGVYAGEVAGDGGELGTDVGVVGCVGFGYVGW